MLWFTERSGRCREPGCGALDDCSFAVIHPGGKLRLAEKLFGDGLHEPEFAEFIFAATFEVLRRCWDVDGDHTRYDDGDAPEVSDDNK